jgi:hypothetical protein
MVSAVRYAGGCGAMAQRSLWLILIATLPKQSHLN